LCNYAPHDATDLDRHVVAELSTIRDDQELTSRYRPEHAFAVAFQVARAFHATFESIVGGSLPTARLRAAVW
jgi:hypothetical protein